MRIALVIVLVAGSIGGAVWGYSAWQHHRAEAAQATQYQLGVDAAQNALTPYTNTGPKMPDPFPQTGQTKFNP